MLLKLLIVTCIVSVPCMTVFLSIGTEACELDQTQHGCRIDNGACTCAYGCRSEFRYLTRKECQDALKGRSGDICGRAPCLNGGHCIQISKMPNYICQCDGTGFWGSRCQRECPTSYAAALATGGNFPHECIVI